MVMADNVCGFWRQVVELHASKILHIGYCDAGIYPIAKAKLRPVD